MFHFKRRTLWIIIYVTIPLILVLNSLGPEPETEGVSETASENVEQRWTLTTLEPDCDRHCQLTLERAGWVRLSAILDRIPAGLEDVPRGVDLSFSQRAGHPVVTLSFPADAALELPIVEFLRVWLPQGEEPRWVMTGDEASSLWNAVIDLSDEFIGAGRSAELGAPTALTVLESPALGSQAQLAYLLWIEVLKQRLAGYQVSVTWDHRREDSLVLFNTTLSADVLYPVTESELNPIRTAYLESAEQTERTAEQIHRYVLTSALYDIPFTFFTRQPARLQQVTLADVNQSREQTLVQITKTP